MALGLQAPGWLDTTWDVSAPGDSTVAGQTSNTVKSTDQWTGFWQGLGQGVLSYAIQRDANKQSAQAQAAAIAPVYVSAPAAPNYMPMLLIGVAVVGVLALALRK